VVSDPHNFFFLVFSFFLKNYFFRGIFGRIGYIAKLENLVGVHCNFFFTLEAKLQFG
jgi:hypothetical protein